MLTLRRCLSFILLGLALSFDNAVQVNQAAGGKIVSSYLPLTLRQEDALYSIGPDGGSIVVMEIDPVYSNILYAGTWGGGMYKSLDGGLSWQPISQGLGDLYINSLELAPGNPAVLYAGTYGYGVFKTMNGGTTWAPTGPGLSQYPVVYTIAVDPTNPDIAYVGTRNKQPGPPWGGGVYKTTNGGVSWNKSSQGLGEDWVYDIKIDPTNPATVYAASHSTGVYKSTNAAGNWAAINNGITDQSTRCLVIDPTHPATVYVGSWHYGGVFKTTDGGNSWMPVDNNLNAKIYSLNMDPTNPNIIYATGYREGIFVTEDGGSYWQSGGLYPDMVYNVMVDPHQGSTLFAGTMGDGFFISKDSGGIWTNSNKGMRVADTTAMAAEWTVPAASTQASSIAVASPILTAIYASIYGGGVYKSTDLGQTWQPLNVGLSEKWVLSMARSRTDFQTLYVGTEDFGFFITKDGGMTWSPSNSGLPALTVRMNFDAWSGPPLRPVQIDQAFFDGDPGPIGLDEAVVSVGPISVIDVDLFDPQKLYIGTQSQGIFRSVNGGGGWSGTNLNNQMVYAIIGDPFNASELYAGCDASSGALYLSLDGGASWNASNTGLTGLSVYALAADPTTSGLLYAGTSQGVYKSTNSAGSWAPLGLPGQAIWAVGVATSNPGTIYAGTSAGLAISKDGGVTWEVVTRGLVNQEITSLVMNPNFLPQVDLIGTAGGSLYRHGFIAPIP